MIGLISFVPLCLSRHFSALPPALSLYLATPLTDSYTSYTTTAGVCVPGYTIPGVCSPEVCTPEVGAVGPAVPCRGGRGWWGRGARLHYRASSWYGILQPYERT